MKKIELGGKYGSVIGNYALVDDSDFDRVNKVRWTCVKSKSQYYARNYKSIPYKSGSKRKFKRTMLHRYLMGIEDSKIQIDHIDSDGLNCQRNNMRIATNGQNGANRRKAKNTSSIYKGVCKVGDKWQAACGKDGKQIHIGTFENEKDAAIAYNEMAKKVHGEFANLNIIK